MNFLTRSSRAGRFAFAFVLWPLSLLASDLAQKNQPVRSPDTPVLIWDIDLKLVNDPPRNLRTSWGCVSAIDSNGRTIWIADAHRDDEGALLCRRMKS